MGRASSSKKVSRAASTGGGRTKGGGPKPYRWWALLAVVVLIGSLGILFSRTERRDAVLATIGPPRANVDHWHAAYGVVLCGTFQAPIQDQSDPRGIHSHADGLIHIHPFVTGAAGKNAVLSEFADAVGMTLTDSEVRMPGGESFKEGDTQCNGQPGEVMVKVNDDIVTKNVGDIPLTDNALITIAFAPKGAVLPDPPTAGNLARLDPRTELLAPEPSETTTTPPPADGSTTPSTTVAP